MIKILQSNIDQYNLLKLKPVLSTRETAVVNTYDEAVVAEKVGLEPAVADTKAALVRAQEDLVAAESGLSEAENAATQTSLSDAEVVRPVVEPLVTAEADLKVKEDALAAAQVAKPQDPAAISDAQFAVNEAKKVVDAENAGVPTEPSVFPDGTPKV